ncbi:MAG: uracil-DNA glycosylase family protein [Muribaculaceae bacterium]|nr:uracil-DNA glycosylase family protein [Muribaculaceae bacterium]
METETHPLSPFVSSGTKVLMAGTFPPKRHRWSMEWFYPNYQNDMWRIWGYIYKGDKNYFVDLENKRFDKEKIVDFCSKIGLGLCDTGKEVLRLKDNASDKFLQIVRPFDLDALLELAPSCEAIAVTGELAGETLCGIIGCEPLKIGEPLDVDYQGRHLRLWRMPSSSRAYPKSIEWKADYYRRLFPAMNDSLSSH